VGPAGRADGARAAALGPGTRGVAGALRRPCCRSWPRRARRSWPWRWSRSASNGGGGATGAAAAAAATTTAALSAAPAPASSPNAPAWAELLDQVGGGARELVQLGTGARRSGGVGEGGARRRRASGVGCNELVLLDAPTAGAPAHLLARGPSCRIQ
jgi:hypothetical protein